MIVKMYNRFASAPRRSSLHAGLIAVFVTMLCAALLLPASAFAQKRRPQLLPATRDYLAGKVVLIPRDDRLLQLRMLAQVGDQDLILPHSRWLDPKPQADKLIEWVKGLKLAGTNGTIFSLDAIAATATETPSVQALKQIRADQPKLPLYGFASLDLSAASKQICQTAIALVADGTLNFLLLEQAESLNEKPAQIARARLIGDVASRQIEDRVAFDDDPGTGAAILIARLMAHRYGAAPKILPVYSSKEGYQSTESRDTIPLNQSVNAKIKLAGGVLPVQDSEGPPSVDLVLFVHTPQTLEPQRAAFAKTISQTIERGARVILVDLARTKAAKDALLAELRNQKQLDRLAAYASSELAGELGSEPAPNSTPNSAPDSTPNTVNDSTREAASRALAQAVVHFTAMKSLRNDLDRVFRIDRAQVALLFTRYLRDWAYNLTVRPKLDAFVRQQKADPNRPEDAAERAEKFTFDQLQPIAQQLFDEQFRRNTHAVLLNNGERAEFRISLLQRLQIRLSSLKTSEAEIKQTIHTYYEGIIPMNK
jgi:hypothetical protein